MIIQSVNHRSGVIIMTMTYAEVRQAWFDEDFDLFFALSDQIDRLCWELGHDDPWSRWCKYQHEMAVMAEQAALEFETRW